jgi:hypothetical protein
MLPSFLSVFFGLSLPEHRALFAGCWLRAVASCLPIWR